MSFAETPVGNASGSEQRNSSGKTLKETRRVCPNKPGSQVILLVFSEVLQRVVEEKLEFGLRKLKQRFTPTVEKVALY